MALEYVGGASANGTAADFSVTLDSLTGGIGTAAQAGDLVIVATGFTAGSGRDVGVTTPGYTEVADLFADASRDCRFAVACKVLTGAEATVTCIGSGVANNAAAAVVHVWRGADAASPLDAPVGTATGINARTMDGPPITPVTTGAVVIAAGMAVATAAFTSTTQPAGYSNRVYTSHDPGTAVGVGIASKAWDGAGTEDPAIWTATGTATGDSWAAVTLAIRPATGLSAITGTASATEAGGDTASGAATAHVAITAAAQEAGTDTLAAFASLSWPAVSVSGAAVETGADVVAAVATLASSALTAAAAVTEPGNDTADALILLPIMATLTATEGGADTIVALGRLIQDLAARPALPGQTQSGAILSDWRGGTLLGATRTGTIIRG